MKKIIRAFSRTLISSNILFLTFLSCFSHELTAQSKRKAMELPSSTDNQEEILTQNYRLKINNLNIPFSNRGNIAEVFFDSAGGYFGGQIFLFSGGFLMSGKSNDSVWANGVAGDILVQDYAPGRVTPTPIEPPAGFYIVKKSDPPFSSSWQEWMDAVYLGADFYDGNGDGYYAPYDINGNGIWDPSEDMPDLLGDETAWCVYNDKVPSSQRRWQSSPYGIEIRQTIFAYSSPTLSNVFFIRYRIKNTGTISGQLDSVYFGLWADGDIGEATDDYFGSDTIRNSGFMYNDGDDYYYGSNAPAFYLNQLQTPHVFIPGVTYIDNNGNGIYDPDIDTPLDSAEIKRGQLIGKRLISGAKNLPMNAIVFIKSGDPLIGTPSNVWQVRNYFHGKTRIGQIVDPCTFVYSNYFYQGIPCSTINKSFWVSGDPVLNIGWIQRYTSDLRFLSSVGPFNLNAGEEVEALAAYVVGRGISPLSSISHARAISDDVKWFYDNNFNSSLISVKEESIRNSSFELYQNYPNPFNPETVIKYQILKTTFVTLKVFNVLGKEIATLINEERGIGVYETEFSASSLPSGVYFYQLITDNQTVSKKMILLR